MNRGMVQAHPWEHLGRQFREGGRALDAGDAFLVLGVVIGVLAAAWLLSRLVSPGRHRPFRSSLRLFGELCRAHRLSWRESWLLWQLAKAHHLAEPASVFLKPKFFLEEGIPDGFSKRQAQIEKLRARLFSPTKIH